MQDSKRSIGSVTKGNRKSDSSNVQNECLNNNDKDTQHLSKKAKLSENNNTSNHTETAQYLNKSSMNTDGKSKTSMSLVETNQTAVTPINRIMRNTSLNLTNSSSSGQTSKRLVIKNLKGKHFFILFCFDFTFWKLKSKF